VEEGLTANSMQEDKRLEAQIKDTLEINGRDVKTYSPLALAFVGDSFYELVIRTMLVETAERTTAAYTKLASSYAKAPTQAKLALAIEGELSEEEAAAFRRGKNASPHNIAKSGTPKDYFLATALESLIGWLYVQGREARAIELIRDGMLELSADRS